jgi:hypothetical protein
MSSHLKQVHAAEVAREEKQLRDHAAHCFGNAGKSQTKKGTRGKDGSSSEKPQDGAGSGKQQGLSVIECVGELILTIKSKRWCRSWDSPSHGW